MATLTALWTVYSCLQSANITGCVNAAERVDRPLPAGTMRRLHFYRYFYTCPCFTLHRLVSAERLVVYRFGYYFTESNRCASRSVEHDKHGDSFALY